jgi:DNA end-binding protein Ku
MSCKRLFSVGLSTTLLGEDPPMARAMWSGVLSFGLVNVPVRLHSAVHSERPHFHLLHGKDESPVRYERICERESKPVPWSEVVKGYEVKKGQYAVLTPEDFKRAAVDRSETIDILVFVPTDAIDARYFETPYYLAPAKGGERAYALLRETMAKAGKTAVAQIVLRQAQHLGAITAMGDALVFTTLRYAPEIVDARTLGLPKKSALGPKELELAAKLVDGVSGDWKPEQYEDRYSDNLLAIIKAKTKKGTLPRMGELRPEPPRGEVSDLMERLRASLAKRGGAAPERAAALAATPRAAARQPKSVSRKKSAARPHRRAA